MENKDQNRPYNSPLREKQAELTRERILEAFEEQLLEDGVHELTLPKIARRAGVSAPTVYRHFPTMDALYEAFGWRTVDKLGFPLEADSPEELPDLAQKYFRSLERHAPLVRAILNTNTGRQVHAQGRQERLKPMQSALAGLTEELSPKEAHCIHVIFKLLISSPTWQYLRDDLELSATDAEQAVAWTIQALLNELQRGKPEE